MTSQTVIESWRDNARSRDNIVTVSIGGNRHHVPMRPDEWNAFQLASRDSLTASVGKPDFQLSGESSWEGISERSVAYSVIDPTLARLPQLRTDLSALAAKYGQDAIGLTVGRSELVAPDA